MDVLGLAGDRLRCGLDGPGGIQRLVAASVWGFESPLRHHRILTQFLAAGHVARGSIAGPPTGAPWCVTRRSDAWHEGRCG
jgi:hypothetical protein